MSDARGILLRMDDAHAAPGQAGGSVEKPAVFFRDAAEFRAWLEHHHDSESELWIEMRKAHVTDRGLTWADAVPEALCFGWIDSVSQPVDSGSFLLKVHNAVVSGPAPVLFATATD